MTERTGASATLKYARISPRKVKIVLDLIRNKPVSMAAGILNNTPFTVTTNVSGTTDLFLSKTSPYHSTN